jgi:hypothetical protein
MALLPSPDMFNRNDLSIIKLSQLQPALNPINVKVNIINGRAIKNAFSERYRELLDRKLE